MFAPDLTATAPRDLLVIVGALEPQVLKDQGIKAVAMAAHGPVVPRKTYGSLADGTARRVSFSGGVEHIGVLYSQDSMREALDWLNAVFDHRGSGYLEVRGRWLGLLFLGLAVLARPLLGLLPPVAATPRGAGLRWGRLVPVAIAPAILTPLILWKAPTHVLPLLLGDYLAAHFLVYGLLTAAGLWLVRDRGSHADARISAPRFALGFVVLALYSIVVFGWPIDSFVASFRPIPARVPLIGAMLVGTLPYFLADEWLTRGATAPRGAYAFTKLCFLVSLVARRGAEPGEAVLPDHHRRRDPAVLRDLRPVQRLDLPRHAPPAGRRAVQRPRVRLGHRRHLPAADGLITRREAGM